YISSLYFILLFLFSLFCSHRDLHSFPTRRSSDLTNLTILTMSLPPFILHEIVLKSAYRLYKIYEYLLRHISTLQYGLVPFQKQTDRKSTRLNSSHVSISYAVFCLKKKTHKNLKQT